MKVTSLMGWTLREVPAVQRSVAERLVRSGYLQDVAGRLVLLPLGLRMYRKLAEAIFSSDSVLRLPYAGRITAEPMRASMFLSTAIQSYRQLPIRWTFAGGGLEQASLPKEGWTQPCEQVILAARDDVELRMRLAEEFKRAVAHPGLQALQFQQAHAQPGVELLVMPHRGGLLQGLECALCGYRALESYAAFRRAQRTDEQQTALKAVPTPGCTTIEHLVQFFGVPSECILKAVMLSHGDATVMALLAGNLDLSLPKLKAYLKLEDIRPATADAIAASGLVPGFIGPVGLPEQSSAVAAGMRIVADYSIQKAASYITGANEVDVHWTGARFGRDFKVTEWGDIAQAIAGAGCSQCGGRLEAGQFSPAAWTEHMPGSFNYGADDGRSEAGSAAVVTWFPLEMILTLQATAEEGHGAVVPPSLAPFQAYLVDLRQPGAAGNVYRSLQDGGVTVLYDDRDVSPGVKFTDAELIGCPIRLTVSKRSLEQGGVELMKTDGEKHIVPLKAVLRHLKSEIM